MCHLPVGNQTNLHCTGSIFDLSSSANDNFSTKNSLPRRVLLVRGCQSNEPVRGGEAMTVGSQETFFVADWRWMVTVFSVTLINLKFRRQ